MTKTLNDLITSNDYTGYPATSASWAFEPDELEAAIYGSNGAQALSYTLVDEFAKKFNVEIISIVNWICTDTEVGLWVLRMQGLPVALVWQPVRKADREIAFLDESSLRSVRAAWESVKTPPNTDACFVPDDLLAMPLPAPGSETYELDRYGRSLPSLSLQGVTRWIAAEGGLDAITDIKALGHAELSMVRNLKDREAFLARLRKMIAETPQAHAPEDDLKNLEDNCREIDSLREALRQRIFALS